MSPVKQYFYNLLVWVSQTINVFLGGHTDQSLSERIGRRTVWYAGTGTWKEFIFMTLTAIINWAFRVVWGEKDHIGDSMNGETNVRQVWEWREGYKEK